MPWWLSFDLCWCYLFASFRLCARDLMWVVLIGGCGRVLFVVFVVDFLLFGLSCSFVSFVECDFNSIVFYIYF